MAEKRHVAEAVTAAAVALLHREIVRHGQVVLSMDDFLTPDTQVIEINVGPNESIVLSHGKADAGREIN